jgi:hypothetical protein
MEALSQTATTILGCSDILTYSRRTVLGISLLIILGSNTIKVSRIRALQTRNHRDSGRRMTLIDSRDSCTGSTSSQIFNNTYACSACSYGFFKGFDCITQVKRACDCSFLVFNRDLLSPFMEVRSKVHSAIPIHVMVRCTIIDVGNIRAPDRVQSPPVFVGRIFRCSALATGEGSSSILYTVCTSVLCMYWRESYLRPQTVAHADATEFLTVKRLHQRVCSNALVHFHSAIFTVLPELSAGHSPRKYCTTSL